MKIKVMITLAIIIAGIGRSAAQDTARSKVNIPHAYWVDLGIGSSTLGGGGSLIYGNAQITKNIVITGGFHFETDQTSSSKAFDFSPYPAYKETNLSSTSLLIGKINKGEGAMYVISAGISYVEHADRYHSAFGGFSFGSSSAGGSGAVDTQTKYTIGLPVLIRGYLVIGQCVGLGLGIHGNFNKEQCTGGVDLILSFGQIQTHPPIRIKKHHL